MEGRFLKPTKQEMNCNLANVNDLTFVYTRLSVKTLRSSYIARAKSKEQK